MTPKPLSIALAAALLSLSMQAHAFDDRWYLAPTLGYLNLDNALHADDGLGLGLALGKALNERWNMEFAVRGNTLDHASGSDLKQRGMGVDGLYFFDRDPSFAPYAVLGLGYLRSSLPGEADNGFSANLGVGFLKQLTDSLALRADARYRWAENSLAGAGSQMDDWLINLGLHIPLGAKSASPAAAPMSMAATPAAVSPEPVVKADPIPAPMLAPVPAAVSTPATPAPEPATPMAAPTSVVTAPIAVPPEPVVKADPIPAPVLAPEPATVSAPAMPAPETVSPMAVATVTTTPIALAPVVATPIVPVDSDHDEVADSADKCPNTPAGRMVNADGCELDGDADGVVDGLDTCPATPSGRSVNALGCELDGDGDGVVDALDKCPATPTGRMVNADGCELDGDADGVVDGLDTCPATPPGRSVNALGCELDGDTDGTVDALDKCPATPTGRKVGADGCELDGDVDGIVDALDSCPATPPGRSVNALGCELDGDGDGVVDALDMCSATPAGRKVSAKGCELDGDGDGIVDALDQCPFTPAGDKVDDKGCTLASTIILKGVNFDSNTAKLRPESKPVLDQAAEVLKRYPHVAVEVAGHTDKMGDTDYNKALSEKRAGAVCDYFILKGIEAQRLRAKGYGESLPIADNKSKYGREENRRVELRLEAK